MRAGLLVNPGSGRGTGKGLALAQQVSNIPVEVLTKFSELESALRRLASQNIDTLAISSGDGTIQAVQTLIAEKQIFTSPIRICILAHGTTNQNANDIGLQERGIAQQAAFLQNGETRETRERPTIRILNPRDGHVRHGMFLGTGMMAAAVKYAQVHLNDRGIHGSKAAVMTFAKVAGDYVFNRKTPDRIDRAHQTKVTADGQPLVDGPHLIVMATTLRKLMATAYPFWGEGQGAIRLTTIPHPPPSLLRWGLPIGRGWTSAKNSGCRSALAGLVEIRCAETFMLDGEFFEGPEEGALKLETGPTFSYTIR